MGPRTTLQRLAPRALLAVLAASAAAVLYRSTARWAWNAWSNDPYYTHALLAATIAVALAGLALWRERAPAPPAARPTEAGRPPRETKLAELAGVPLAAALYLLGFVRHSPYLLAWSFFAGLAALALATGGLARVRRLAPALGLFALAIPVPFAIDVGLALQQFAFAASAGFLALLGVGLAAGVTTFDVGGLSFEVTPQCSGFQSAISLLAIGALIVALVPMSRRRKLVVLLAAVPLALALNVARILTVVGIGLRWGAPAAEGFFHDWSSASIFLVETVLLLVVAGAFARRRAREVTTLGAA